MKSFSFDSWFRHLTSITFATLTSLSLTLPTYAAEKIYFVFDSLILSLRVSSLETYAKEGKANQQLNQYFYFAGASEEDKKAFREALLTPVTIDPVQLSRVLNTEEGERILNYVGKVINIPGEEMESFSFEVH